MNKHQLKTDPKVFEAMKTGGKNFEIRLNDRDYKPGDMLCLNETKHTGHDMRNAGLPLEYTGRRLDQIVVYVLHGPIYGLTDGWVIMAVEPI